MVSACFMWTTTTTREEEINKWDKCVAMCPTQFVAHLRCVCMCMLTWMMILHSMLVDSYGNVRIYEHNMYNEVDPFHAFYILGRQCHISWRCDMYIYLMYCRRHLVLFMHLYIVRMWMYSDLECSQRSASAISLFDVMIHVFMGRDE